MTATASTNKCSPHPEELEDQVAKLTAQLQAANAELAKYKNGSSHAHASLSDALDEVERGPRRKV